MMLPWNNMTNSIPWVTLMWLPLMPYACSRPINLSQLSRVGFVSNRGMSPTFGHQYTWGSFLVQAYEHAASLAPSEGDQSHCYAAMGMTAFKMSQVELAKTSLFQGSQLQPPSELGLLALLGIGLLQRDATLAEAVLHEIPASMQNQATIRSLAASLAVVQVSTSLSLNPPSTCTQTRASVFRETSSMACARSVQLSMWGQTKLRPGSSWVSSSCRTALKCGPKLPIASTWLPSWITSPCRYPPFPVPY